MADDDGSTKRKRKDSALQQAVEEDLRNTRTFTSKLLEASLNGIYIYDLVLGTNVYLSPQYTRLLGHTLESLQAMSKEEFFGLFHSDEMEAIGEHMQRVVQAADGEVVEIEYRFKTADGRWIWCLSRDSVFDRDEEGNVTQFMGTFLDITERKQMEQRLLESEGMYRRLVDMSPDIIATVGLDGRVIYGSLSMAQFFGVDSPREIEGRPFLELVPPEEREGAAAAFQAVATEGRLDNFRCPLLRAGGSTIMTETSARLMRDEQGAPQKVIFITRDITERELMEARIAQTNSMASVGLLAAGVAHEINNPLTFVLQNVQSLAEDLPALARALSRLQAEVGPQRVRELIGDEADLLSPQDLDDLPRLAWDAEDGARRVRDIVRDLKTFSHSQDERLEPLCLNDVIDSSVNMAHNEIRYRAGLARNYGEIPDIVGNEGKLAQVFLNLLVNATQAIEEGDVEHNEIRVSTRAEDGYVVAEIEDTGRGIAAGDLPHLFEPFFTTKDVGLGMGLGLSICHNIVAEGGGEITVESEEGQGTRFAVRFPVSGRRATGEMDAPSEAPPSSTSGRFLVIDDEPLVGRSIMRVLGREHDTVVVISGAEAQELLAKDQGFDGILCDLMMPGITGMDVYEWLAAKHPNLARRTVFLTGGAFTPRMREFLARAKNTVMQKPYKPETIRTWAREMAARSSVVKS